jgi:hypothetical protein
MLKEKKNLYAKATTITLEAINILTSVFRITYITAMAKFGK